MPTFMEKCNCRGVKPAKVLGKKHYSRPEVLVNLLQDRHVARLLRAPAGSGKSSLAFEYANIVFGFEHVFWVDCTSPCFLRDLDNGSLFHSIMQIGADTQLVVCEDIPLLDQQRAEMLNSFIDSLLEEEIEVLLTCTPSSDSFSHFQRDAIVLGANDMLLTDLEMEGAESAGLLGGRRIADVRPQDRIACNLWSSEGSRIMLSGLKGEILDEETRLAMFAMLVFRDTGTDCLKELMRPEAVAGVLDTISEGYVCFGLDRRLMAFQTIECTIEEISSFFCKDISEFCSVSVHKGKDDLCCSIADMLLAQRKPKRACEFMAAFAERRCSIRWLGDKGMVLLHNGEAESFLYLYGKAKRAAAKDKGSIDMLVMLALLQIDDIPSMAVVGRRILRSKTASARDRCAAASLMLRCSGRYPSLDSQQKIDEMEALVKEAPLAAMQPGSQHGEELDLAMVSDLYSSLDAGPQELMMNIASRIGEEKAQDASCRQCEGSEDALFMGISWLFEMIDARNPDNAKMQKALLGDNDSTEEYMRKHVALETILDFVSGYIEQVNATEVSGYYACKAVISFKNISSDIFSMFEIRRDKRQLAIFERFDAKYTERRDRYRRRQRDDEESKREYLLTHPDAFRRDIVGASDVRSAHMSVPTMRVKLFGCMEIRIGDELISPSSIYRKKTKTLIALLVLGRDRECARDQLARELWPEASMDSARRNFYTVVAELRRALSFEGSCPYLIRTQTGYRLDTRLVTSDVYEFDDVCRSLLFERTEAPEWEHLYAQVTKEYSGLLMPFEVENETIVSLRKRMNLQLVDGLLATSARLLDDGQNRGALWFAREAMGHDGKREDVYIALMEAQIACDQRGEALDTYFSCVRFLNEGLGIDPSKRLVEQYKSIIESEEDF